MRSQVSHSNQRSPRQMVHQPNHNKRTARRHLAQRQRRLLLVSRLLHHQSTQSPMFRLRWHHPILKPLNRRPRVSLADPRVDESSPLFRFQAREQQRRRLMPKKVLPLPYKCPVLLSSRMLLN